MNCAEKLLEPTIFFNLYTKSPRPYCEGTTNDCALRSSTLAGQLCTKFGWNLYSNLRVDGKPEAISISPSLF